MEEERLPWKLAPRLEWAGATDSDGSLFCRPVPMCVSICTFGLYLVGLYLCACTVFMYTHIYVYTYVFVYTHAYMKIHRYTYTCMAQADSGRDRALSEELHHHSPYYSFHSYRYSILPAETLSCTLLEPHGGAPKDKKLWPDGSPRSDQLPARRQRPAGPPPVLDRTSRVREGLSSPPGGRDEEDAVGSASLGGRQGAE